MKTLAWLAVGALVAGCLGQRYLDDGTADGGGDGGQTCSPPDGAPGAGGAAPTGGSGGTSSIPCEVDSECPSPPPSGSCSQCDDGVWVCLRAACASGQCTLQFPACASACPLAGSAIPYATPEVASLLISCRWARCSSDSINQQAPEDGLQIEGDRFRLLRRDSTGQLVPVGGADNEGSVTYLPANAMTGAVQVDFSLDSGGGMGFRPVVTDSPRMLILNNNGVYEYRYVAADETCS
jgi:hypothetical protein